MSFQRHRKSIFRYGPECNTVERRTPYHRVDEFPTSYSLAACAPALPASASPVGTHCALQSSSRSRNFQRTANSVLTVCVMAGGHPTFATIINMDPGTLVRSVERICELPEGSLAPTTAIKSIEGWDSLRVVELVALLDSDFGVNVEYQKLTECKTLSDLMSLIGSMDRVPKDTTVEDPRR